MAYPTFDFAILTALLAVAAASDVGTHRIPNVVVAAIGAMGIGAQLVVHGASSAGAGLLAGAVIAAALWPAWTRGMMGGGDLKLGAAAATWVGLSRLPMYLLATGVAAGVLAVGSYGASSLRARAEMRRNLAGLLGGHRGVAIRTTRERGRAVVPAGAAFAIGALCALVLGGRP